MTLYSRVEKQVNKLLQNDSLPFKNVLGSDEMVRIIDGAHPDFRDRVFSPLTTLLTFLTQMLRPGSSCRQAVARVNADRIASGLQPVSSNTGAYCQARDKLSEEAIKELALTAATQLEEQISDLWLWKDRHVKVVDGSTLSMPDTPDNQREYPQQTGQKPGCGFPISRVVGVMSLVTGSILNFALGTYQGKYTGECSLFRQLLGSFSKGDVALGDGYYGTYFIFAMLANLQVESVFKIHGARNFDFKKGKRLGYRDHIVQWSKPKKPYWLNDEEYDRLSDAIDIREVEIQVSQPGFRTKTIVIVTTFLCAIKTTKDELADIFRRRWYGELYLRNIKATMQMSRLRCKSPAMVRKEVWAHILSYNLICRLIAQAASKHDLLPHQISFKGAMQALAEYSNVWIFGKNCNVINVYEWMLYAIAKMRVANRPNRIEPRAIKRRQVQYDLVNKPRQQMRDALIRASVNRTANCRGQRDRSLVSCTDPVTVPKTVTGQVAETVSQQSLRVI